MNTTCLLMGLWGWPINLAFVLYCAAELKSMKRPNDQALPQGGAKETHE